MMITREATDEMVKLAMDAYATKRHPARWDGKPWGEAGRLNHVAAMRAAINVVLAELSTAELPVQAVEALKRIKLRLHFMGWPAESFWNAGTEDKPHWIPDWRYECQLIENVLHGTQITTPEKPTDTKPANELPVQGEAVTDEFLQQLFEEAQMVDDPTKCYSDLVWQALNTVAKKTCLTTPTLKPSVNELVEALKSIAYGSMDLPMAAGCAEETKLAYHAEQAWRFISIAANALASHQSAKEQL